MAGEEEEEEMEEERGSVTTAGGFGWSRGVREGAAGKTANCSAVGSS